MRISENVIWVDFFGGELHVQCPPWAGALDAFWPVGYILFALVTHCLPDERQ